ncbi:MAG: PAS domain S-box protein [Ignavibacteriales bacterium]|nr:PAS domain S-box protein [Ignavibacteriales bacterium]
MINYGSKETGKPVLFTLLFGLLTSGVGIIAILGWILGVPLLASFNSDFIPMAPSTAFLFISFGIAILFSAQFPKTSWFYKAGIIICSIGTLISLILLFLSSFGIHPAVEHSGFKIEGLISGTPYGHISPLTAFCFVLAGLSFLISQSLERQKLMLAALSSAFLVILISIILLLAHLFGTPLFYGTQFIPPALSTSLALFFLGIALIALISPKIWQYKSEHDAASTRSFIILISVFVVLATGIISAGYLYYKYNEKEFRLEKEQELSSVADLKISELTHIRKEWVEDASLFYENIVFSTLVDRYFNNQKDILAHRQLQTWLSRFKIVNKYNKLSLLDANGIERFTEPDSPKLHSSTYKDKFSETIKSGKITIVDFYRNEYDQHIYLNILVPIADPKNSKRINGVLSLRIDPEEYLYPYIKSWPTPSKTSETILVRREGDDVLFLNEVKLKQNTALSLRISLQKKHFPAVKAVQGEEGIVEGYDYRDVLVLADIHHVPNSTWFLVTKIDIAEVYEPLTERLWMMIFLITALLFGAGTSVAVVWRHQRARFYQERFQSAETLRDSYELLEKVFNNTHIMMAYLDPKFNFIRVNQAYAEADEHTPDYYLGKNHFALFPYAENETLFRNVVDTGQTLTVFAKPFEYAEHPERGISYWDWSLQPVKASDGSVTALVFSLINVTKHMQSQEWIQKLNRVYAVLSNINQAIVRIHDIDRLFNEICRIAIEEGKFRMVWIGMINPQTNMVDVVASAGLTEDYLNKIKIDLNDKKQIEGPTLKTLRYGHYTISNDIATDENMLPWREEALKLGYRSSASLPIKVLGTVRGVIKLYSDEVEFFAEDEIKLLDEMAMDVSFALEFIEHEAKRKQAEEFLLKFRLGVERSGDAVLLTDPDGTIVYVNPAFENIFGYTKEEAVGKTPRILKSGTLNQEYYKNFWNDLLTKKAVTHEIINKTKDGRLLSIEASVNPIINERGEIIGHLAIERDITGRKRAEKTLQESEASLAKAQRIAHIGSWELDIFTHKLFWSEEVYRIFGFEIGAYSLTMEAFFESVHPDDRVLMNEVTQASWYEKKPFDVDHRIILPNGKVRVVHEMAEVIFNDTGQPIKMVGTVQDITDRKLAEEEIVSQKNRFEQLFENSPIAIVLLDDQDKVVQINESFSVMFGYFLEEVRGQALNDIIVPPELKEEAKSYSDQTSKGNQINKESYRKRKDGSNVFVQIIGVPVAVNDKTVGIYGMYVDLTQRKEAEEKMKLAKELAEQSDKLKSEFLAQMSHEIRTPINIMAGNVDYLKDLFSEKTNTEASECFDGIDLASKRIIRTVDLILNVAELQTSGYKPHFIKVDNSQILNKLYKEHQLSAKQKGLELIYKCELKEAKTLADEYSVTQIFANLIDNALKYTKKGKVEILLGKNKTGNIMVEVKDTGIGMSKEFLSKIFDPFVQEEQGYSRSYEGNGLGLTLTKKYCDINNAIIEVESEKNVGSTFRVIFKS